jgi:hypothetical protein
VVSVVIGALLLLIGFGVTAGGAVITWADNTQRDSAGYLTGPTERYTTPGYALRFGTIDLGTWPTDADLSQWLGTIHVSAASQQGEPVFIGIADTRDVNAYLGGMMSSYQDRTHRYGATVVMGRPSTPPTDKTFWTASANGTGQQSFTWEPSAGTWTLVVMNADASAPVDVTVEGGATIPALQPIGIGLLVGGGIALLAGGLLVALAIATARPYRTTDPAETDQHSRKEA